MQKIYFAIYLISKKKRNEGKNIYFRSDLHCLFLNSDTWQIFCWECDKEIYVDSHKKLYEAAEFVKKVSVIIKNY